MFFWSDGVPDGIIIKMTAGRDFDKYINLERPVIPWILIIVLPENIHEPVHPCFIKYRKRNSAFWWPEIRIPDEHGSIRVTRQPFGRVYMLILFVVVWIPIQKIRNIKMRRQDLPFDERWLLDPVGCILNDQLIRKKFYRIRVYRKIYFIRKMITTNKKAVRRISLLRKVFSR